MSAPRAFISYSWDDDSHKQWVADLATDLRNDGVDAKLDQWHAVPGDQLPVFMEREIRENDYVLIVCTPNYRLKSDARKGGVGYEGDIMTAEVHTQGNHRKFIPVLARGTWEESAPSWLKGKYYVDLSNEANYGTNYSGLTATLLNRRPTAPPVRTLPTPSARPARPIPTHMESESKAIADEPIKIIGVIVDEVTVPKLNNTPGSALYAVPLRLSRAPSQLWSNIFVQTWNCPPSLTTKHRPGIASVQGARIILNGTTIDEIRKYHRTTLISCINAANRREREIHEIQRQENESLSRKIASHRKEVEDVAADLSFD